MNTQNILQRNEHEIERQIGRLNKLKPILQPFLTELTKSGLSEITDSTFHNLAAGANLERWIKERTLAGKPNFLPDAKEEVRLESIKVNPYTELKQAHQTIFRLPARDKADIQKFTIANGELQISEATVKKITDDATIYGNDDAVKLLELAKPIADNANQITKTFGFNPIQRLISINAYGETGINIGAIPALLAEFERGNL